MVVAPAPALPALSGIAIARYQRGRPQTYHRATLSRGRELQGHQGTRGQTAGDVVVVRGAATTVGQTRARTVEPAQRTHAQGGLRGKRFAVYFIAHPGTLRC